MQSIAGLSLKRPTFKATPAAAPTGPSKPSAGAPTDGPSLDDFKPSIVSKASLITYPVLAGGGGALAGYSSTAAIVAGVVAGGTAGMMVGAGIGLLIDLIHWGKKSNATAKLGLLGAVVGGIAGGFGASLVPHVVIGTALGLGGLALGIGIAKATSKGLENKQKRKVDAQLQGGSAHISKLFRQMYDRDGKGQASLERNVRACEQLEAKGWRFGTYSDTLSSHFTSGYQADVSITAPDGGRSELPLRALPTLAYLEGIGPATDLDDAGLVDAVKRFSAQNRPLYVNDYRATDKPGTPNEASIRLAAACEALTGAKGVAYVHDGVPMHVEAKDGPGLEAAMKTVDDLVKQYDQNLAPAFQAGTLDGSSKARVFESLLKSPYGTDLSRSAPLLTKLAEAADKKESLSSRTWDAISTFESLSKGPTDRVSFEQAVDDAVELSARMPRDKVLETVSQMRDALANVDPAKANRFHSAFMRVLRSTGDRTALAARAVQILTGTDGDAADAQVSALEKLASAASLQKDYADVMLDQATLNAAKRADETLDVAAGHYARLLGGLATSGKADEAATTYAFIKAALRDGRATTADEDALITQFLEGAKAGDATVARNGLLKDGGGASSDVADLEKRLKGALDERTAKRAAHLFASLPNADRDAHLGVIETLSKGASYQQGYNDLLMDYATLMAVRDPKDTLDKSASEYCTLLSGLGSMKKADEAAPTYAFMRSGMVHGRFGSAGVEQLTEKFFTAMLAGADARRARQTLLAVVPSTNNTVTKDDKVVVIGGVAIPVKNSSGAQA